MLRFTPPDSGFETSRDRERRTGRHGASLFPRIGCELIAPRSPSRAPPVRQAGSA